MNGQSENIIVNSCELTPIYLIPSTSVTQAGSYIITQSSQDIQQQPVADNLKTFYESSGNLESGILNSPKPRILKKQSSTVVGNNLKLASFLLPKTESVNVQNVASITNLQSISSIHPKKLIAPLNNVVVQPVVTTIPVSTVTSVVKNEDGIAPIKPLVEIDRKIVRVGTIPNTTRKHHHPKALTKTKPNEKPDPNASKHTSVQLIKLGETYHSLNQLSEDQMKIVNKALKMFSNKEKAQKEPAYDPVTNTKFIYKVVSPRDLAVVGKNKVGMKKKNELKKQKLLVTEEPEAAVEPKVTRSGRTVKLPKQMRPGVTPQKPKKKVGNVVNCFQCSAEFCSFYRLQRHYEMYPTHIPARIHSNLFHCLLAIIKGGSESDQANIFVQQLEQLIEKLKSLWPCLLKKMDGMDGKLCTINDDLSRLLGMDPGKYNLNIDALNCVKDKDGHCVHNPSPKPNIFSCDVNKPSQLWLSNNEETAINEAETEDCARINSVDKWPTVTKRIWKLKQQRQNLSAKKMRLTSENEQPIEPGIEDLLSFSKTENDAFTVEKYCGSVDHTDCAQPTMPESELSPEKTPVESQVKKLKTHAQFHSAHFDIRSSPIKLPSSLVRRFQINPDKESNFEVQILRPLALDMEIVDTQTQSNCDLQDILDNVQLPKETTINTDISFTPTKDWSTTNELTEENFIKTDLLFESGLTPDKNSTLIEPSLLHVTNKQNFLLETPNKNTNLNEANILEISNRKSDNLIEHVFLDVNNEREKIFGSHQRLMHEKDEVDGFFDHSSLHVQTKCNSLIGSSVININKDKAFESALSHVKERSNNLFDTSLLQSSNKANNLIQSLLDKHDNSLFDVSLSHDRDRSNSLFESNLIGTKDKVLIDQSLLQDDNSNLFVSLISQRKSDRMLDQSLENDKSNGFGESFSKVKDPVHIDISQDSLGVNESRLLSSQGQSVLNFLDSLGNESLSLGYPETEIRNNSVDFHLDLFSFNNS